MSEKYTPKKGDRVRVVLEGEVTFDNAVTGDFRVGLNDWITHLAEHVVSIEKIEPPVEVFKPGDVVRSRATGDLFTLADEGYVNHFLCQFYGYRGEASYRSDFASKRRDDFTSEDYEKVNLSS